MKQKTNILVTGAGSQLGKSLQSLPAGDFIFDFQRKDTLDIRNKKQLNQIFEKKNFDYCLNFAAYTDVNSAEKEPEKCFDINAKAVENLAKICKKHDCTLVHISTDYVFDGKKDKPYDENDPTNPINIYGKSKQKGEAFIRQHLTKYIIIRTSWLYSAYNRNFVKTIIDLSAQKKELQLVNDQTGTPTFALDLVRFILFVIQKMKRGKSDDYYGIFHFSNNGEATWFEFGEQIIKLSGSKTKIIPVTSGQFLSPAKRPAYSVLSKNKIKKVFNYEVRNWKTALQEYFETQKST